MQSEELKAIFAAKRAQIELEKKRISQAFLRKEAEKFNVKNSLSTIFWKNIKQNKFIAIAEIKNLTANYTSRHKILMSELALAFELGGATCIALDTDKTIFQNKKEDLKKLQQSTKLPILDKDLIVSKYQIYQSAYLGADAIMLKVAMLDEKKLKDYNLVARELDLDVVVEVNNIEELELSTQLSNAIICLNTKYLFENSQNNQTQLALLEYAKKLTQRIVLAEGAINSRNHIKLLKNYNIKGCILGEVLLKPENPSATLQSLLFNNEPQI